MCFAKYYSKYPTLSRVAQDGSSTVILDKQMIAVYDAKYRDSIKEGMKYATTLRSAPSNITKFYRYN